MKKQAYLFMFFALFFVSCSTVFLEETQSIHYLSMSVSVNTSSEYITVEWKKQQDAVRYEVWKGESSDQTVKSVPDMINVLWRDTDTIPGRTYYYLVKAFNAHNNQIGQTKLMKGVRAYKSVDLVQAPSSLSVTDNQFSDRINLYWYGQEDVTFRVYRSDKLKGKYVLISEMGKLEFEDLNVVPGTEYFYKVASLAQDSEHNVVEKFTEPVLARTLDAPANVKAGQGSPIYPGQIKLSWDSDPQASYYKVFRASTADGYYSLIAPFVTSNIYIDVTLTSLEGSVIDGIFQYPSYFYKVMVVKNGQESGLSLPAKGYATNPADLLPAPNVVLNLNKSSYPYKINLSWESVGNTAHYHVSKIKGNQTNVLHMNLEQNFVELANEPFNEQVDFLVQAVNTEAGDLVGRGDSVRYVNLTPAPLTIATITTNFRAYETNIYTEPNPSNPNASENTMLVDTVTYWKGGSARVGRVKKYWHVTTQETGVIDLTWEKTTDLADSFNIYRSTSINGTYELVASVSSRNYKDDLQGKFTDSLSKYQGGYGFFYKVSAVFSGQESQLSEPVVGYALNPTDILDAPSYITIPFHYATGTGFGGLFGSNPIKKGVESPIGIDQVVGEGERFNHMRLTWATVPSAKYRIRHSVGSSQENWYDHGITEDTKKRFNNEISSDSYTHMFVVSDSVSYSQESASFEVTSVNPNASNLLGDTVGIWFQEHDSDPY